MKSKIIISMAFLLAVSSIAAASHSGDSEFFADNWFDDDFFNEPAETGDSIVEWSDKETDKESFFSDDWFKGDFFQKDKKSDESEDSSDKNETTDGPEQTQFYTNFSEYPEGADLFAENWNRQLAADDHVNLTVKDVDGETGAEFERPSESDRDAATWSQVTETEGEVEAYAEWRYSDSDVDMRPSVLLHGSGDSPKDMTGIRFENRIEDDSFSIAEYNDGDWSGELSSEEFNYTEGSYYSLRAWTDGTEAEMTVWERGQDEEDGVTVTSDQTTVQSGEFNGFFEWQDDPTQYPYLEVGFGLDGDQAPTSGEEVTEE